MKKFLFAVLFGGLLIFAGTVQAQAPASGAAKLEVGDAAPDFTLTDTAGQKVTLSELRGKSNVVLAFYVFAFTGG